MRIMLVEDERKVASFIARALKEDAYAVDVVDTGEHALQLIQDNAFDAVLLDIRLPGMSGIEVCRKLRKWNMDIPVLMLTARSFVEQRVEGLDAGADDYLTKPFEIVELLARVRALLRRASKGGNSSLSFSDLTLDRRRRRVLRGQLAADLTQKEMAILELLLLRAPEIVTRSEIIEHVWDCRFDSESNLVDVYVNRLRQKIDPSGRTKLIHTARGVGYRMGVAE